MPQYLQNLRLKAAEWLVGGGEFVFKKGQFERVWGSPATHAGIPVTPHSSLQTVAVMRCVKLIAGIASTLPIDVFQVEGEKRVHVIGNAVEQLLDVNPNDEMTAASFRFAFWAHFLLWGNAFARKAVVGKRTVALWLMVPWAMEVIRVSGEIRYRYTDPETGKQTTYDQSEVLHVPNFTLDGVSGISVIAQNELAVSSNQAAERTAAVAFRNGTYSPYAIESPQTLIAKKADEIKKRWRESNSGWENAGVPPIIEGGGKIVPLPIPFRDLQFLEQRQFTDEQICIMFGVPPPLLGIMSKTSTWPSSTESLKQFFLDFTLSTDLKRHESAYDKSLITDERMYVKHNTKAYLRANLRERMESYRAGIMSGIYSPNECRSFEDMDPYDGGDVHLTQQQNIPVDMAGEHLKEPLNGPTTTV